MIPEARYSVLHLFCGIGGGALGFQEASAKYRGVEGRFETLGGVDVDPAACRDFAMFTGVAATRLDLFSRRDYEDFHGYEPPAGWREATGEDLLRVAAGRYPDVVFLSAPCKGFTALLPKAKSESPKYQALNRLALRGLALTMEAFGDDPPSVILFENVPRITTRGKNLLAQIRRMLGVYGYLCDGHYHDCGEIGGLAQRRKRYLLIARNPDKMSACVYEPPKRRVRSIGEVLGPMPTPDDPGSGPMHRLPKLQWKTWVRLALIPAGGDWRDLEKIGADWYRSAYRIMPWGAPASTVTSGHSPSCGATTVADPRLGHTARASCAYAVRDWAKPSSTVTGRATVNGGSGCSVVADPRLPDRVGRHPATYQVLKWEEPGSCVTGTRFGSGAPAIADPRLAPREHRRSNSYTVRPWDSTANTITGEDTIGSGAQSVADPRPGRYVNQGRVIDWEQPAPCIAGGEGVRQGAPSCADPRLTCRPRNGVMGVLDWAKPSPAVIGANDVHAGASAVADPRVPGDGENGAWVIVALDGTWHRPLTTLELLALQSFPTALDGRPVVLAGKSDSAWRERIGNAVPPEAARGMAEQILMALMIASRGEWTLGATPVWVAPEERPQA